MPNYIKNELQTNNQIEELKKRLDRQKHKVEFVDRILKDKDDISLSDFVTVLIDEGYPVSEDELFSWLLFEDFLVDYDEPNIKYIEDDIFVVKTNVIQTIFGEKEMSTTLITPNGQLYLVSKYKEYIENKE